MTPLYVRDNRGRYRVATRVEVNLAAKMAHLRDVVAIEHPDDAAEVFLKAGIVDSLFQEHFWVLYLTSGNGVLAAEAAFAGSLTQSPVYLRPIAVRALELGAANIVFGHHHPSGDPTPSPEDIQMTRELKKALEPLDIFVLDHLIFGGTEIRSLNQMNLMD